MTDDHFTHTVTLPDGRVVNGTVYGINHPAPDGFEIRERDPLRVEWADGSELDDHDYLSSWTVKGQLVTLEEFVIDQVLEHGRFHPWEPDDDY